jgi:hypothetical protein
MEMRWLLLIYRIPRKPSSARVYAWRKLNQLGAVALQDAVWILPANDRNREQFRWIASEIIELGGDVTLFDSNLLAPSEENALREQFEGPVATDYQEILDALRGRKPDLAALAKQYQRIKCRDYFRCPLGEKVRTKLLSTQQRPAKGKRS